MSLLKAYSLFLMFIPGWLLAQNDLVYTVDFDAFSKAVINNYEELNTKHSEFAPYPMLDGLVFLKSDGKSKPYQLEYYNFDKESSKSLTDIISLPSKFHHGPVAFAALDSTLFYSHNSESVGRDGRYQMLLSTSSFKNENWTDLSLFPHNGDRYSILHPATNREGNVLVFASDMPGGFGKTDLYLCTKVDTVWSEPVNLGPLVNTEGNDLFPFFYQDRWLFFSSDGREGFGGFDLYVSQLVKGAFAYAENLGEPLNSNGDDIGLVFLPKNNRVVMSSNRSGGEGSDDLYEVLLSGPFYKRQTKIERDETPLKKFEIFTLDKKTNLPISGVSMQIREKPNEELILLENDEDRIVVLPPKQTLPEAAYINNYSDLNGKLDVALGENQVYLLEFSRDGFVSHTLEFDTQKLITEIYIFLEQE